MQNIRVRFEKRGRAVYISHLDLMRAMSRAVRRAQLPLWYTEGFRPHPYLFFPLPLPLGQESCCEALELRLERPMPPEELLRRLTAVLPEDLKVTAAAEPWSGAGEIHAAQYEMKLRFADEAAAGDWSKSAASLLEAGKLTAKKTGKQGRRRIEKEIALAPLIFHWALSSEGASVLLKAALAAGSTQNLNPALLLEALFDHAGEPLSFSILRTALLRADGTAWE
ncbi:MAG: TIGR03936 family radical SAM-associated protein [Oscillospiraceae bacterium]|jgi:radical SAM-linked protein|nr:TIGR03936 family radical SAM-associated protein [Oscillospiraceae bacterium]